MRIQRPLWLVAVLAAAVAVSVLVVSLGCRTTGSVPPPEASDSTVAIYLVEHGWHAGIAIRRSDMPAGAWAVQDDFPDAAFLEVGWGDAAYYPHPDPGAGTLLKAGLLPTKSVLHVAAFRRDPVAVFGHRTVIRIPISKAGRDALLAFIRDEHARRDDGSVIPAGPGLYGDSQFYASTTRYHVFNNCNTWVARALRTAGCAMAPARALTVRALLAQARDCGMVVAPASS